MRVLGMKAYIRSLAPVGGTIAALFILLVGCSSQSGTRGNLAHACQTRTCTCESLTAELSRNRETTEPKWLLNGDAYCPEGFTLKRIDTN